MSQEQSTHPKKYSVVLNGHATSITVEPVFWEGLQKIAKQKNITINSLISEIDESTSGNLSSALRIYAYKHKQ